jgi:DNA-directed RNA polymerase subunit M/transcription elongation factor TFIIS
MDIEFSCNKCGQHIVIDEAGAGQTIQCPKCRRSLTVPAPSVDTEQLNPALPESAELTEPVKSPRPKRIEATRIHFQCPECKGLLSYAKERAMEKVKCPLCKKAISVPDWTRVWKVFLDNPGLETTLRTLGGVVLALSILAAIVMIIAGTVLDSQHEKVPWLSLVTFAIGIVFAGVIEFYFFCWAGEMLAAVKKMAGLSYEPHFKTYEHKPVDKCSSCGAIVKTGDITCPNCQRALVWPEKET